ncbi:MAG: TIGR04255 family protein [Nitrospira sp.]|nr:TIGR04255 family protein [Nitrospira sp.]
MSAEQYPNQPLIDVAFEIRFPGDPAVECRRDEFFRLVRDKYPMVYVPKLQPGEAPALALYHFKQEDDQATIMTAINKLAYSTKKYPGFDAFKEEVLRIAAIFGTTFKIEKLTRMGLRYVNAIPFVPKAGSIPLREYLKMGFQLPPPATDNFTTMNFAFASPVGNGTINARIEHMLAEDKSHEAILLDFDYAMQSDLVFGKIGAYLEESHSVTKQMFEGMITDEYRNYIRGEEI